MLACIDKIINILTEKSPLKLADSFNDAFLAFLPLCTAMLGIMCLAPLIADILSPFITPVLAAFGADPGMVGGLLTAIDMGGYPIAMEMVVNKQVGIFAGIIVASMMGANWVFNIPVGLSIIPKEDRLYFIRGLLAGLVTVPIGAFVGGLMLGLPVDVIMPNLALVIILAAVVAVCLVLIPTQISIVFVWLGRIVMSISVFGIGIGVFQWLTGSVLIGRFEPITPEIIMILGNITLVLIGAFALVAVLQRALRPILERHGLISIVGFLATLAHNIPMYNMFKTFDKKGKILNAAFQTSASFVIADHLAFALVFQPGCISALVVSKLVGGLTAIPVALLFIRIWRIE